MCGMKEAFVDIDESYKGKITFGDLSQRPVEGRGRILIKLKNGEQKFITEVFYVPDMKNNILSLGQFLEKGFEVQMKDKNLKIFDESGAMIASVKMTRNRMFPLDLNIYLSNCFKAEISNMTNLWHLRYGHLNCESLMLMEKNKMVLGIPKLEHTNNLCEVCVMGKQHRKSFPKKSSRASQPLELVYSDVCGPITPTSIGGNRYLLTFIDDFSGKTWVYVLKEKKEVLSKFKEFKNLVEKQSECKLKSLRTDRGGEYVSHAFDEYCKENGIAHQLTMPQTPQQNGVSERKKRTIMNMVRCMLKEKN